MYGKIKGNFLAGPSIGHPVMNSRQSERSVPWTTRGRVEINISFHGSLFINGLWQRYISSSAWFFLLASHNAAAGQRRVFALPCVHPRAGRECIALTKRKAYRASLLWAKRIAVWSNLTITKAVESKTKLKINNSPSLSQLAGFYELYVDACMWLHGNNHQSRTNTSHLGFNE